MGVLTKKPRDLHGFENGISGCEIPLLGPGEKSPGFEPPVSRFRTPGSFWSEITTFRFWHETVKTGGGLPSKTCFFPCFALFARCLCFTSYLRCLLVDTPESWQTGCWVNALQLRERSRSYRITGSRYPASRGRCSRPVSSTS